MYDVLPAIIIALIVVAMVATMYATIVSVTIATSTVPMVVVTRMIIALEVSKQQWQYQIAAEVVMIALAAIMAVRVAVVAIV